MLILAVHTGYQHLVAEKYTSKHSLLTTAAEQHGKNLTVGMYFLPAERPCSAASEKVLAPHQLYPILDEMGWAFPREFRTNYDNAIMAMEHHSGLSICNVNNK